MSEGDFALPEHLHYGPEHEWSELRDDGSVRMGITDFAQGQLGDIVFVQLPQVGSSFEKGDPIAEVESAKTVSDIMAPCSGEVVEVNVDVEQHPAAINTHPYDAWLLTIRPSNPLELDGLMSASQYQEGLAR